MHDDTKIVKFVSESKRVFSWTPTTSNMIAGNMVLGAEGLIRAYYRGVCFDLVFRQTYFTDWLDITVDWQTPQVISSIFSVNYILEMSIHSKNDKSTVHAPMLDNDHFIICQHVCPSLLGWLSCGRQEHRDAADALW